jgi:hypothetical protein
LTLNVLIACEYSGIVRDEFLKLGHNAFSCDLLPCESTYNTDTFRHYQGSIFDILNCEASSEYSHLNSIKWDLMVAHPPCTHLSVSGQRWFPPFTKFGEAGYKDPNLKIESLNFVRKLLNSNIPHISLENPRSIISGNIRRSDQTIHPYLFGHPERKTICLWLKNLPHLNPSNNVYQHMLTLPHKVQHRILWLGSGKGKERSKFYQGIAQAMALQYSDYILNNITLEDFL